MSSWVLIISLKDPVSGLQKQFMVGPSSNNVFMPAPIPSFCDPDFSPELNSLYNKVIEDIVYQPRPYFRMIGCSITFQLKQNLLI